MEFDNISISSGSIPSTEGLPIRWDLYSPISGTNREFPVILFIHGFKGFKDWGAFPDACEDLARSGFGVVTLNLSHNGIGDNKTEFDRLDLFATQTFTQDLNDIESIIKAIQAGEIRDNHTHLNTDFMGIVGHSRGAHLAITAAAEFEAIQSLVTWGAVANYLEFWTDKMKEDWDTTGITEVINSRTKQIMPLEKAGYDDALQNEQRVIALHRVKDLRVPALFIHGRKDESVPYTHSEQLHIHCAARDKELRLIANAGHTFGISHPFQEDEFPGPFQELLDWTIGWFREYLR
ncbi:MAG: alpha/beta fold hydrolase [Balneolales bacterium]|nr:alpha/beta fold hydrolase [Balneolales bacterium]